MAAASDDIVVKKECESGPGSPEIPDAQDSDANQSDPSGQKQQKVWGEEETRTLIQLHKTLLTKFLDNSYTKKKLWDDIALELQSLGYDITSLNVCGRLKTLRQAYRRVKQYNAKHVLKKEFAYLDDLDELYKMEEGLHGAEEASSVKRNFENDDSFIAPDNKPSKKPRITKSPVPASHVDLRTVVTSKKMNGLGHKAVAKLVVRKKVNGKMRTMQQPQFQCGLCDGKFSTSQDLHGHPCKANSGVEKKKPSATNGKKNHQPQQNGTPSTFQWNSMNSMQLLEILSQYQQSAKNSNFRKGHIWQNVSSLMQRHGYDAQPKVVEDKWKLLSSNYIKTITHNKRHKDKKKCSFFNRLSILHKHPSSFKVFEPKQEPPVKMTVEVSPFSFSSQTQQPTTSTKALSSNSGQKKMTLVKPALNGTSQLLSWLDSNWKEFKELERKREEAQILRHMELMEMLSYLVDGYPK